MELLRRVLRIAFVIVFYAVGGAAGVLFSVVFLGPVMVVGSVAALIYVAGLAFKALVDSQFDS